MVFLDIIYKAAALKRRKQLSVFCGLDLPDMLLCRFYEQLSQFEGRKVKRAARRVLVAAAAETTAYQVGAVVSPAPDGHPRRAVLQLPDDQ